MRKFNALFFALALAGLGLFLTTVISVSAGGPPGSVSATVNSGESNMVAFQYLKGSDSGPTTPVPLALSVKPKNGTVTFRKTATRTEIFYQSKKGFTGQDQFQFLRTSNDGYAGTYSVAVTVK